MTQDPPKKGISMDEFMTQPEGGLSMDEFMSDEAAPETPPFLQAPPQQQAGGGAPSTASVTPQAQQSAPSAPATAQPSPNDLTKSVLPAELGGDPIVSGIRDTEQKRAVDLQTYEQSLARLNELNEKEAKIFSAREAAKGMPGMVARLDKQLSDLGKERAQVKAKEKEFLARAEEQASELASNATAGDKYKSLVQVTDGFEQPNPTAIHEEAKRLASKYGVSDGTAYRRIYNKLSASVEQRILEPAVNEKFDKALAPIMEKAKLTAEKAAGFKGAAQEEAIAKAQLDAELKQAEEGMRAEMKEYEQSLSQAIVPLKAAHDEAASQYEATIAQLEEAMIAGQVTEQQALETAKEAEQQYRSVYDQYAQGVNELNMNTLRQLNAVKSRYNRQFEERQARILSSLNEKFDSFNKALEEASGDPEVRSQLKAAYQKAWGDAFADRDKAMTAAGKVRTRATSAMFNPMVAASETFLRSYTTSLGGALKGIGTSTNSDLVYLLGDEMEKAFITPKAQSKKLSDLLDLQNVAALSGELAGGMTPSILTGIVTSAATQGAGAPAGVSLVVTSMMSWAAETADIAGRAKDAEFAKSGDMKKAEEAFNKSLKSQVDLMPMYALDGLPFVDKALGFIGYKPMRVMTGMGTEYTVELMQEIPQGIAEKNISEGRDPWENLFSEITEQDHSELMIGMAPVALLGGAGQINSKSNAEVARDRVLSYIGKSKVSEWVEDARAQWVSSMVTERGQPFAASVITTLFSDGRISEAQFGDMLKAVQAADERSAAAKKAGLSPKEADVFTKLHAKADDLRARAAAEPSEVLRGIMEARANELSASADAFLAADETGMKEGNYITVRYADGSSTLMDVAQAKRAFADPDFAAEVALVGMSKDGINIESGGAEAAALVDEFMLRVENAQNYAASVRMDPRFAQQTVRRNRPHSSIPFGQAEQDMLGRVDRTADPGIGSPITPEQRAQNERDAQVQEWKQRDILNQMAKASDGNRPDLEAPTFEQAEDMVGRVVEYEGKEGFIDIDEGGKVTFTTMDGESIVEMGTREAVSPKLAIVSEVPLKNVVNPDGSVTIYDQKYVGDIAEGTKRNKDGDVTSVTLQTEDGQQRTFRGQVAELIAYENLLRTIDQDPVALEKLNFNITTNADVQQLIQSEQERQKRRIAEAKRKRNRRKAPRTPAPVKQDEGAEARDAQGYTAAERAELQGLMMQEELDTVEQRIKDLIAANPKHFKKGPNGEDIIKGKAPGALHRQWIDLRDTLAYKNLTQNDGTNTAGKPGTNATGGGASPQQSAVEGGGATAVDQGGRVADTRSGGGNTNTESVGGDQALRSDPDKAPVAVRTPAADWQAEAGVSSEAEEVVENEGRPYLKHSNGVVVMQLADGRVVANASGYKYKGRNRNKAKRSPSKKEKNARNTAIRSALVAFEEKFGIDTNRSTSNFKKAWDEATEKATALYRKLESPTPRQQVKAFFLLGKKGVRGTVLTDSVRRELFPDENGKKATERINLEAYDVAVEPNPLLLPSQDAPTIQGLAESFAAEAGDYDNDTYSYPAFFEAIISVLGDISSNGVAWELENFASELESAGTVNSVEQDDYPWYSAEANGGITLEMLAEEAANFGVSLDKYMSRLREAHDEASSLTQDQLDQRYEQEREDLRGTDAEGGEDADQGDEPGRDDDEQETEAGQGEDPGDFWNDLKRPDDDDPMFMASDEGTPVGSATTVTVDGKERPALNNLDKPIHPTVEGIQNFWRWFGDSKVVDEKGRPMVVYHGSPANFTVFDQDRIGDANGRSEGAGFYFTTDRAVAEGYAEGGTLYEVYIKMDKPLGYSEKGLSKAGMRALVQELVKQEKAIDGVDAADGFLSNFGDVSYSGKAAIIKEAADDLATDEPLLDQVSGIIGSGVSPVVANEAMRVSTGYDGYVSSGFGGEGKGGGTIYVVPFPANIKSATGNLGRFDPNNPDIQQKSAPSAPIKSTVYTDRVLRALQKLAPGVTITQHKTRESYAKAIGAYYQQQKLNPSQGAASSRAVFLPANNEIHISEAGSGAELIHEAAHPVLTALIKANPERFMSFYNELLNIPEAQPYIKWAEKHYAHRDELVRAQEAMVEFMRGVFSGEVPVSLKADSLWQRFKNWVKELLAWAGFSPGAVDMSKPSDVRAFASAFAEAIRFGRPMEGLPTVGNPSAQLSAMADAQRIIDGKARASAGVPLFMLGGNPSTSSEWNAAIDTAIESVKAGKKPSQAIEAAAKSLMAAMGARGASAADQVRATDMLSAQLAAQTKRGSQAPKTSKAQKAATAAASTVSKDTVEVKIMAALKDQIRLEARAAREAKLDVAKKRAEFAKAVTGMLKASLYGRLQPKQSNALTTAAARTNPDSPRSVERFFAYADKVITNANYVEDLGAAKKAVSKAEELKNDTGIPNNLREVIQMISKVNPSLLSDPASFAARVSMFYNTFKNVNREGYNMASSDEMSRYMDTIAQEQGEAYAKFIEDTYGITVEGVNAKEMLEAIKDAEKMAKLSESLDEDKQADLRFALVQQAEGVRAELAEMDISGFTKEEQADVRALLSADFSHMKNADIADYIFGVDNILVNESLDGIEGLSTTAEATVRLNRIAQMTAGSLLRSDWADNKTIRQMFFGVHNAVTTIAGFTFEMGKLANALGIMDVAMAKTSVDETIRKETTLMEKRIIELKKEASKNGRDIDSAENRVWEGVIAFVIQRSEGLSAPASFENQKRILSQDIGANAAAYPKEYAHVVDAVAKFITGAADAKEVMDRFRKERPENYELMKFMMDMNARYRDEVLGHRLRFRNIAPSNLENYVPITYVKSKASSKGETGSDRAKETFSEPWQQFVASMSKPREAGSLRKREARNLRSGMRIDFNLRLTNISKLSESLYDARVSKHWMSMYKTLSLETSDQVMGGAKNTSMLIEVAQSWYTAQSMNTVDDLVGGRAGDRASKILRKLGSFYGLAGVTQLITQSADQATNAAIMQGLDGMKMMGESFADVGSMMLGKDNGLRSLISLGAIGERAEQLSGTKWSTELESSISRLRIALESGAISEAKRLQDQISSIMFWSLKTSDTFSATSAWVAFYKQALKNEGLSVSDWTKEAAMVMDGDVKRKDAFAYAEMMTAQTQGPSDPSMFAPWARRGRNGWMNLFATAVNPFSSFSSSVRARLYQAGAEVIRYSGSTAADKVETERYDRAMRVIVATAGSQAAYISVKYALAHAIITGGAAVLRDVITNIFGEGDDEEWASRFAFWSEFAFTMKAFDRDVNRMIQTAAKDLKKEATLGPAYDREQERLQKARDNMKIGYTRFLLDMTIGGVSSTLDDGAVRMINYGYYSAMVGLDAPELKKRDGTFKSFEQWHKDIENTPLGQPGQWSNKAEYGLFDLVVSRGIQLQKTFKGYGEGPTAEEISKAVRAAERERRFENSDRFNTIVWRWRQGDKEARKEADRLFGEFVSDQPVERRKAITKAYFNAKRLPADNPVVHLLAAEPNPVVRATVIYQMMANMNEEEKSKFRAETMRYKEIWDAATYKHYLILQQASKK